MRQLSGVFWSLALLIGMLTAALPVAAQNPFDVPDSATAKQPNPADDWRFVLAEFDRWAAVQKLYTADQIKTFREKLIAKESGVTGSEREEFLDDIHSRLQVLLSLEAHYARDWFERMDRVSAPKKMEKIKSEIPDVARLSANEIAEALDEFARRQGTKQQQYDAFNHDRQRAVEQAHESIRSQEEASRAARAAAASQGSTKLGANQATTSHRDRAKWTPRPSVASGYAPYTPRLGNTYVPYDPNLGSGYHPNLGGAYRW